MRGEQVSIHIRCRMTLGSPPLARGTVITRHHHIRSGEITPACAGNSGCPLQCQKFGGDHPRLRGEQFSCGHTATIELGSPPLARGTVNCLARVGQDGRITPACAGNRTVYKLRKLGKGDHPRLRGEQASTIDGTYTHIGSPPLARGTDRGSHHPHGRNGITPACAGNSRRLANIWCRRGDHPRLRGEQLLAVASA